MYQVEVTNQTVGVFNARARDAAMTIYTTGQSFSPVEALLASLGACVGFFVRTYIEQARLDVKEFSVRTESELSQEEKPMALRKIRVRIDLKGSALDERRKEALLAFVKNCPIKATLELRPEISVAIA